jgi:hypothetical protein
MNTTAMILIGTIICLIGTFGCADQIDKMSEARAKIIWSTEPTKKWSDNKYIVWFVIALLGIALTITGVNLERPGHPRHPVPAVSP